MSAAQAFAPWKDRQAAARATSCDFRDAILMAVVMIRETNRSRISQLCSGERYLLSHSSRLLGQNITPTLYTCHPPHHLPRGSPCPNTPVNTAHTPPSVPSTWRLAAARGACRYDGVRASSWEATTYIGRQARPARRTRTSCRERLSPETPARSGGTGCALRGRRRFRWHPTAAGLRSKKNG